MTRSSSESCFENLYECRVRSQESGDGSNDAITGAPDREALDKHSQKCWEVIVYLLYLFRCLPGDIISLDLISIIRCKVCSLASI